MFPVQKYKRKRSQSCGRQVKAAANDTRRKQTSTKNPWATVEKWQPISNDTESESETSETGYVSQADENAGKVELCGTDETELDPSTEQEKENQIPVSSQSTNNKQVRGEQHEQKPSNDRHEKMQCSSTSSSEEVEESQEKVQEEENRQVENDNIVPSSEVEESQEEEQQEENRQVENDRILIPSSEEEFDESQEEEQQAENRQVENDKIVPSSEEEIEESQEKEGKTLGYTLRKKLNSLLSKPTAKPSTKPKKNSSTKQGQSSTSPGTENLQSEIEKLHGKIDFCNKKKGKPNTGKAKGKGKDAPCEMDKILSEIMKRSLDEDVNPFNFRFLGRTKFYTDLASNKFDSKSDAQKKKSISQLVDGIPLKYNRNSTEYDEILNNIFEKYSDELAVETTVLSQFREKREEFRQMKADCPMYDEIQLNEIPAFKYLNKSEGEYKDLIANTHPDKRHYDTFITKDRNKQIKDIKHCHLFNYGEKGLGIRASRDMKIGTFISEYRGIIRTEKQIKINQGDTNYTMTYSKKNELSVDSQKSGSFSRFLNHSCKGNVKAAQYNYKGNRTIILATKQPVKKHEELVYDYGKHYDMKKCLCNTPECRYKD